MRSSLAPDMHVGVGCRKGSPYAKNRCAPDTPLINAGGKTETRPTVKNTPKRLFRGVLNVSKKAVIARRA